jgi:hypothetical protein
VTNNWLLVAVVVVQAMLLITTVSLALDLRKERAKATRYRDMYRAARWLGQWNYNRLAAVQDVAVEGLGTTYAALMRDVDKEAASRPWMYLGQVIPEQLVPDELRHAAGLYNRAIFEQWPDKYGQPNYGHGETPDQVRARQLQDALLAALRELPTDAVRDIVDATGAPYNDVKAVIEAVDGRRAWDVSRVLGASSLDVGVAVDPEEVLPARY